MITWDKELATLLVSIIGAAAWLPFLYEKLKKPNLVGKVISTITIDDMTMTDNASGGIVSKGIFYLYKLSVSSLGANFHPKNLKIKVVYGDENSFAGRVFVPRNMNGNLNGSPHKISPPRDLLYPNICIFKKDFAQQVYIPFCVDRATACEVKKVNFEFEDFHGHKSSIEIDFLKIDTSQLMFEEIFEPLSS